MSETDPDVNAILGPGGRVASLLPAYEARRPQLEMASAVAEAIAGGRHLIVEAGTGVGKSFSYLIPALQAAEREGVRVVVSTRTIQLQEQLVNKDIPFLKRALPFEFKAELVKGRANYVSLRRLNVALGKSGARLFESTDLGDLQRLRLWAKETRDGSRSDLDFRPSVAAWEAVESDSGNCLGRECPSNRECFYFQAVRRARTAHLLVVNHALYLTDLALRRVGASLLPDHDVAIFDEAHSLESVAAQLLGLNLSSGAVVKLLNRLAHPRTGRGLLAAMGRPEAVELVAEARRAADQFFGYLGQWRSRTAPANGRVHKPLGLINPLSEELRRLASAILESAEGLEPGERIELDSVAARCDQMAADLSGWLDQALSEAVYWVETRGGETSRVQLACSPLDVGPVLRDELFDRVSTCIMTSATLAVGSPPSFQYFERGLGLGGATHRVLGSPFDYKTQVKLHLVRGLPDPSTDSARFEAMAIRSLPRFIEATGGHALVLFTSYKMMEEAAKQLRPWFGTAGIALLVQGGDWPRSRLVTEFKRDASSVLFGTDSFWEGVDVPGEALSHLIVTRLPFRVPTEPLQEARKERVERSGGRWFEQHSLPEAILRLKQGFGRLIRTSTDQGRVTILDPRVLTKGYGRRFLDSLPACPRVIEDLGGDRP